MVFFSLRNNNFPPLDSRRRFMSESIISSDGVSLIIKLFLEQVPFSGFTGDVLNGIPMNRWMCILSTIVILVANEAGAQDCAKAWLEKSPRHLK